jgi:uncharacterized protein
MTTVCHVREVVQRFLKSLATERQLLDVLARPSFAALIAPATRRWFEKLLSAAETIAITERIIACRDPTDDKFLELAINGQADLVVFGRCGPAGARPLPRIPIITPAAFVQDGT